MGYFFSYDRTTGEFKGWYHDGAHQTIPQPAIAVSDEEYLEYRDLLSLGKIGKAVRGKIVFEDYVPDLMAVKNTRIAILRSRYNDAQNPRVTFKNAAGFSAVYSCTDADKANVQQAIDAGADKWTLNLWLDATGTPVAPITFADLKKLKTAMDKFSPPTYDVLLSRINDVLNATTAEAVEAVVL